MYPADYSRTALQTPYPERTRLNKTRQVRSLVRPAGRGGIPVPVCESSSWAWAHARKPPAALVVPRFLSKSVSLKAATCERTWSLPNRVTEESPPFRPVFVRSGRPGTGFVQSPNARLERLACTGPLALVTRSSSLHSTSASEIHHPSSISRPYASKCNTICYHRRDEPSLTPLHW